MTTWSGRVAASSDDAWAVNIATGVTLTGVLSVPGQGSSQGGSGCRFLNVTIAQGTTITSAVLSLRANGSYSGPAALKVRVACQASDTTATFATTSGNLNTTNRPRTAYSTDWDIHDVTGGTVYTKDITAQVQAVLNRAGWVSGNSIVVLIDALSTTPNYEWQEFDSYDTSAANAPLLTIEYTAGGGGISGSASITLGALTASSAGTVAVKGATSATLGALTSTAAGKVAVAGTANVTLGALTSSAAGVVAVAGSLAQTLGDLTVSAAGVVGSTPISGAADITLGALSVSAAGAVSVSGALAQTLAALTSSGAGVVSVTGSASVTLDSLTVSGAGVVGSIPIVGSADITLSALTASGAGTVAVSGSASITLGDLTGSASGNVAIVGAAAVTLGSLTGQGSGAVAVSGSASVTLGALTVSAAGIVETTGIYGTASITLGSLTVSAAGIVTGEGIVIVVPPDRVLGIPGENRVMSIPRENRVMGIPVESRVMGIRGTYRDTWTIAEVPPNWVWTPFAIYRSGTTFQPVSTWSLDALMPVATHHLYVSPTGNDSTGADWAHAFTKFYSAILAVNADADPAHIYEIHVAAGTYGRLTGWASNALTRTVKISGVGDVVFTNHQENLSWSLSAGQTYTYQVTRSSTIDVLDSAILTAYGDYTRLTLKTSIAEVEANAGSWYTASNIVYVHTADNRAPDSNILVMLNSYTGDCSGNITVGLSGVKFFGGSSAFRLRSTVAGQTPKLYAADCEFSYCSATTGNGLTLLGAREAILQDCLAKCNRNDGYNPHTQNSIIPLMALIDCEARDNGESGNEDNGATMHDGGSMILVGGEYYRNKGPNVIPSAASAWCLGTYAHDSQGTAGTAGNSNFNASGGTGLLYADRCRGGGSLYDFYAEVGCSIYLRESDGITGGVGTIGVY